MFSEVIVLTFCILTFAIIDCECTGGWINKVLAIHPTKNHNEFHTHLVAKATMITVNWAKRMVGKYDVLVSSPALG
jgi:hypothetical protein